MIKHKWLLIILISLILIQSYFTSVASSISASSSTDEWTMFRNDPSHSGYTTGNGSTNSAKILWTYEARGSILSSPAVANGCVFVGSRDRHVYCLNSSNGKLLWNYTEGSEVNSSPAVYNGFVYIGANDGFVYCLDVATGMLFWKSEVGGAVRSSPAVVEGRVYIGSGDHNVFCLNASDGAEIWSYPTSHRVRSSPAVSDGVVYVASDDYHVYALNASTGNEIWRRHTGSRVSSPSIYDGHVYIGSIDGFVCCLNASTGAKIWEYQTENSVTSSPAVAYGCVYVGAEDNNVYCLNASNGEKIWQSPTGFWVWSSPVVSDGNVYIGSQDYSIYCLDASTGAKKWSYATGNYVDSSPAIVNGTLYVGSHDTFVYAFALCNSTNDTLPSQSTNSVTWTTIAFNVIACAVGATVIFAVGRFVLSNRRAKRKREATRPSQNTSWFSAHAEALCILAILAFSTMFFLNLARGPLWESDEKTYSQWAFSMVKSGDYLTPWAFGELAMWIAKPPLIMWLMSLAYQIFGVNSFALRLVSPVFGALSLIFVFYLGRKLHNSYVGLLSALVLGTFTTFYVFARHAMTDVPFLFFVVASIYFLLLSEKTENTNRYVALSGLFFGLALMTKQIQALLIPLILFVYFIATKRSILFLFTKRFTRFWGVALLIFSPWAIYMTLRFGPDFWYWYFAYSAFTRTVSPIEGHFGGYFYYFSYLGNNENLSWIILLPFATGLCAFNAIIKRLKADTLILVWMSIVLVVFTFAQTKLEWYILPAFPAFAIAISSFLYQLSKKIHLLIQHSKRQLKESDGGPAGI